MPTQLIGRHLVESAPRTSRGVRPFVVSLLSHGGLIALAVAATLHPRSTIDPTTKETVAVVNLSVFTPQAVDRRAKGAESAARGFQALAIPAETPLTIPGIDARQPAIIPEDFTARGIVGGLASGIGAAILPAPTVGNGDPIDGGNADEPPYMLPGQMGPDYPAPLRSDRPDGVVVVRFVIDTLGHVEPPSLLVVESSHPLFVEAVRTALERLRFLPARFSGQRVRVRMVQRFEFHLASG